jgi:hypothetical protein
MLPLREPDRMLRTLANFVFKRYDSSAEAFTGRVDTMTAGSVNVLITGTGRNFIFRGLAQIAGPLAGGKVMMNVGEDYAGLGAYNETGIGSVFRVLGAWFFIGAGTLYKNGVTTSASALTTLQIKKVVSGALGTTYQAGLAKPSAPTVAAITPPTGFSGKNNGVVSVKIARVRSATGARSNASLSSNAVQATNQSISVTFPSADVNGQDYWEVDVTRNGEGAVGNHFFLQEIPESVIAASTTSTVILDSDTTIRVPNGTLTSSHIGWAYRVGQTEATTAVVPANITTAGNARCIVTAAGMAGSPKTVTFAVALNDTAAQVAGKARTALAADANVSAFFNVGGESAEIILTVKTIAANDATMNFTLEDVTSAGITDDLTSTDVIAANDTQTYITTVGAADSGGAGYQLITLAAASVVTANAVATFTRAVAGTLRTYVFEWRDADIVGSDLAPIRDYPPPAGIFGGASGDVVFVDGCLGDTVDVTRYARDNSLASANTTISTLGNAIAVSDPSRPESFPPDNYVFTGDAPTAVLQGGDGIHWRFSRNSMGAIRYVGGSPAISYEKIWSGIGIQNQNQCVLGAGGRLYAYTGQKGLVRLGVNGEPETLWAAPVHEDLNAFTSADVVLGYDANQQYVLVGHGSTMLAFHEPTEQWCSPLNAFTNIIIPGTTPELKSMVTYQGNCYISLGAVNDLTALTLYNFNSPGTGTLSANIYTPWVLSGGVSDVLSRISVALRAQTSDYTTGSVSTYINGDDAAAATTTQNLEFPIATGGQLRHGTILRPNVRSAKSWRVSINIQTDEGRYFGIENIRVEGETSGITQ